MKRTTTHIILLLIITAATLIITAAPSFATEPSIAAKSEPAAKTKTDYPGSAITIRIEGTHERLACKTITAHTFAEALQKLSPEVNVAFYQHNDELAIFSVDGTENGTFGGDDGWYGFVIRGGRVISPDSFINMPLEAGDEAVLYYGSPTDTKIITDINEHITGNSISFNVSRSYTSWVDSGGYWRKDEVTEVLPGVKIHLKPPGDLTKLLVTNTDGHASADVGTTGVYSYYAEKNNDAHVPDVVRTNNCYFLYGFRNLSAISRAEAAAFIVNQFRVNVMDVGPQSGGGTVFSDVLPGDKFYREIKTAVSTGILRGYDDGTFRPDKPVSLFEFSVMLSQTKQLRLSPADVAATKLTVADLPDWGRKPVEPIVRSGLLNNVTLKWFDGLNGEALMQIFRNLPEQGA